MSLATQPHRRAAVVEALRPFEAISDVRVHDALDGRLLTSATLQSMGFVLFSNWCLPSASNAWDRRELRRGEIGCALSHLAVWREAQADERYTLVFEDDVEPSSDDAVLRTVDAIDELAANGVEWDLLYLGRGERSVDTSGVIPGVVRTTFSYCTHGYVITARAARALASCGYDQALFPVDELLPALYGEHRRADVRAWAKDRPRLIALAMSSTVVRQRAVTSVIEESTFLIPDIETTQLRVSLDARVRWTPSHVVFYRSAPSGQAWHVRGDLAQPLLAVVGAFQQPRTVKDAAETLVDANIDVASIAGHLAELGLLVRAPV